MQLPFLFSIKINQYYQFQQEFRLSNSRFRRQYLCRCLSLSTSENVSDSIINMRISTGNCLILRNGQVLSDTPSGQSKIRPLSSLTKLYVSFCISCIVPIFNSPNLNIRPLKKQMPLFSLRKNYNFMTINPLNFSGYEKKNDIVLPYCPPIFIYCMQPFGRNYFHQNKIWLFYLFQISQHKQKQLLINKESES